MKKIPFATLLVSLLVALPAVAEAQVVVRTHRHGTRVVVNPPGPGNRTVVRVGPRGNTVVNPPGPGRIVIRH